MPPARAPFGSAPSASALAAVITSIAFAIGLTLPDIDLHLWLEHRSAVTHSVLPMLVLLARRRWHAAACGVGAGSGLHLAADTFPNRMVGFATIKLPLAGALPSAASYAWLAINALLALVLAAWLARRLHAPVAALLLTGAALAAGGAYLYRTDGGWPVLAIAAVAGCIWWRARARPPA